MKRHRFLQSKIAKKIKQRKLFNYSQEQLGSLPGTLNIDRDAIAPQISLIDYDHHQVNLANNLTPESCREYFHAHSISWFNVDGLGNENFWRRIGNVFGLHPLILEDIVNVPQKPKVEDYQDHLVIITQMVSPDVLKEGFIVEQVSLIIDRQYLLTVQEGTRQQDYFATIKKRITLKKGNILTRKHDYLAYSLWDMIIDGFFPVLEIYSQKIEELEDEVIFDLNNNTLSKIYKTRRELLALRRAIWSQRNALNSLIRDKHPLIEDETILHLRDCYDHAVQIIDIIETYRELTSGLTDIYLSAVSNKMNEVMKLLTVISSIFIPITFVTGIYGMNFNTEVSPWNMPELNWYWSYPVFWLIVILISASLVCLFWRKGWFRNIDAPDRPK